MGYKAVGEARSKRYDQFRDEVKALLLDVYDKERKQASGLRSELSSNQMDYFD